MPQMRRRYFPENNPFLGAPERQPEIRSTERVTALLSGIESAAFALPRADVVAIAARVFEHSAEDGLKLAERLRLTPDELFGATAASPGFALKHPRVFEGLKAFVVKHEKDIDPQDVEAVRAAETGAEGVAGRRALKLADAESRKHYAQVEAVYADLVKKREIKERGTAAPSGKTAGERLADAYLSEAGLAMQGAFYGGPVRDQLEALYASGAKPKKLGKWLDFIRDQQVVTEAELGALCAELKLDAEKFKDSLRGAKYVLYGAVHGMHKTVAVSSLKSEIKGLITNDQELVLDEKTGKYEVVGKVKPEDGGKGGRVIERKELKTEKMPAYSLGGKLYYATITQFGRYNILDEEGNEVPTGYQDVEHPTLIDGKLYFVGIDDGINSVATLTGPGIETEYDRINSIAKVGGRMLFIARKDGRYLIADDTGKEVEPKYRTISNLVESGGRYYFEGHQSNGSTTVVDQDGREYGDEEEGCTQPVNVGGVIHYIVRTGPQWQEWFIRNGRGETFGNGEFITQLAAVGGKAFYVSQDKQREERVFDKEGKVYGDTYAHILRILDDNGRLVIVGKTLDGKTEKAVIDVSGAGAEEQRERTPEFEKKVLESLDKMLKSGVGASDVAGGLIGLDTEEAWDMRERLPKEDKDWFVKFSVAKSLAGLDSDRAWEMRESLAKDKAALEGLPLSLGGLDSPRAWELRKKWLKENKGNDMMVFNVAMSLTGLDSEEAWKMREALFGSNETEEIIAQSLAGLDSDRAWEMRERLSTKPVLWSDLAIGLAGLDSERAWDMRERLFAAAKPQVAQSLAGVDSERAWEMREEIFRGGRRGFKPGLAESLLGLDSDRAWEMREWLINEDAQKYAGEVLASVAGLDSDRAWEIRRRFSSLPQLKQQAVTSLTGTYFHHVRQLRRPGEGDGRLSGTVQDRLDLLNLVHAPEADKIEEHFRPRREEAKSGARALLEKSATVAKMLNQVLREAPEAFLATMGARRDRSPSILSDRLTSKIFPEVYFRSKHMEASNGLFGFMGGGRRRETAAEASLEDFFQSRESVEFNGGGAEQLDDDRELMEFREPMHEMVVTGLYGKYDEKARRWSKSRVPLRPKPVEPMHETTVILPKVRPGSDIPLPMPLDASLIPERVHGIKSDKTEVALRPETDSLGESVVRDLPKVEKVAYSLNVGAGPEPLAEVGEGDYRRFRERFVKAHGPDLGQKLANLPEEMDAFLVSPEYLKLQPKERVAAIENYVRSLGYYDTENQEVSGLKDGRTIEERMLLQEMRLEELRSRFPERAADFAGRRFAGVCADFAEITCAILRRAGFLSGIANGLSPNGKIAQVKHAHAAAFVVWPDVLGQNRAAIVDGTPSSSDPRVSEMALAPLEVRETAAKKAVDELVGRSKEELESMLETIRRGDTEAIRRLDNGRLERVLNVILSHEVKQSHADMLTEALNVYWYGGLNRLDEANQTIELTKLMEGYLGDRRALQMPGGEEPKPAGTQLFGTIEDFIRKFKKTNRSDDAAALDRLDRIYAASRNALDPVEARAFSAIVTYLRGKNMAGKKG